MSANQIKAALNAVHALEASQSLNPAGMGRVQAIEHVIKSGLYKLTHQEVDVLLNSLHVSRLELTVQF